MLVSVVIPCYNHGLYLEETVKSVVNSKYDELEIIIVDDGSTDNSKEVAMLLCSKFSNVSYYFQANSGPSVARNFGLSQSSGKYILPLYADYLISDNYIVEAVSKLNEDTDFKIIYTIVNMLGIVINT